MRGKRVDRLISEKKAIEAINDYWGEMEKPTIDGYINAIKAIPSTEPKTGHWIVGRIFPTKVGDENLIEYRCSECDRMIRCTESQLVNYPYCHCGARMESEQNG